MKERNIELAWNTAGRLSPLDLARALRLTVLLGEFEAPGFQPVARRWLVRFIQEAQPTLEQVKKAADALNTLRTFIYRDEARNALHRLADQIAARGL